MKQMLPVLKLPVLQRKRPVVITVLVIRTAARDERFQAFFEKEPTDGVTNGVKGVNVFESSTL